MNFSRTEPRRMLDNHTLGHTPSAGNPAESPAPADAPGGKANDFDVRLVPNDLKERDQWILWKYEERNGKLTKVPYQKSGKRAKTDDPSTWGSFGDIFEFRQRNKDEYDGIGYVFSATDPYTGVDLDSCLDETGRPKSWAQSIIETFSDTYMEESPGGHGIHIFTKAKLLARGKRKDFGDHAIEAYDEGRYFTVTGRPFNGAPLQVEDHQADVEKLCQLIARGPTANGHAAYNRHARTPGDKIPKGHRHRTLVSLAGTMRRRGMRVDSIDAALWAENCARCEPPYDRQHIRKVAESAAEWEPAGTPKAIEDLLSQPYTDTGNAERLVILHGENIHFCWETKRWFVWDGHRWKPLDHRQLKVFAKQTIRRFYEQAAFIDSAEIKQAAEQHARKSESAKSIQAMLTCAEYEKEIPVSINQLDQDPFLLNCLNGTLDLRTGELREHRREDLITKLVHLKYYPDAECPRFLQFLERIMGAPGPDESEETDEQRQARCERVGHLMSFLQKLFGYSLTGDVSEKAVFCFVGSGNNGKTTLLEVIRFILAEYSAQILIDNLMQHHARESNASLADLSDLRGARLVVTSEAEEGQRLAVGKLKYLTQGAGEINAKKLYENPVAFAASHKLFLDANHKPIIRSSEKAVWNRLKLVPFTIEIPQQEIDKSLLGKLKCEAEGILAWMVKGCQRWWKEGLGDPPEVAEASAAWRAESDRLAIFLNEKCVLARYTQEDPKRMWARVENVWPSYLAWCEANKERAVAKTDFDGRLKELGCWQGKEEGGSVRVWRGIRFKTPDDERRAETEQNVETDA